MKNRNSDHCEGGDCSRVKYWVSISIILLTVGLLAAVAHHADGNRREAGRWMESLDLSLPAFWPSGTPLRQPLALVPAVDTRFIPSIPRRLTLKIDTVISAAGHGMEARP